MDDEIKAGENEVEIKMSEPIVINLGKQKRKRLKKLMKGRGKLWYEIEDVIDEVAELLGEELEGKTILPLVLVYKEKPKTRRGMFGL